MSETIRKGNPFKPTAIEGFVMKGMSQATVLRRSEVKFNAGDAAECPRRAVKYLHTTRKGHISPASRAYMTIGIAIHEMVSDALYKTNRLIFKEFRLPPREKPDIRGIVDNILFGADDKIVANDVKSCGALPRRPRDGHELQVLTYSALTGLDFDILYVSRRVAGWDQKLMIKSFQVDCNDGAMHNTLSRICSAYFANAKGVLPDIPVGFEKDKDCRFCPFQDECWEGEAEDLPNASSKMMLQIWDKAEERAAEILLERDSARTGILKHIERHAPPNVQKKLSEISWS
jgi:hypothetical protein